MQPMSNRGQAVPGRECGVKPAPGTATDQEERELIERIATRRDAAALERLYAIYAPRLLRFLRRLTTDRADIEEVCNDVLWVVWKQAGRFRGGSKVSTWIFSIAYRICIKVLKKSAWRPENGGDALDNLSLPAAEDGSKALEERDLIAKALPRLSPKHRMVIELSYYFDHSYDEIAAIAQCPVNTVKTRMFHARRQLREIVEKLS